MIEKFLIEAKKQTYANKTVKRVEQSRKGSYDYEYKKVLQPELYLILLYMYQDNKHIYLIQKNFQLNKLVLTVL